MVGEALAGFSALKAAFDIAKGLKDIDDTVRRNAAVIELQEKIIFAQQAQSALTEQVRELEKEVVDLKTWHQGEKKKYDLKCVASGAFAYVRKEGVEPPEPTHWLCTKCYENGKKSILQYHRRDRHDHIYRCSICGEEIRVNYSVSPTGTSSR
jgi:hypothetical protein